MRRVSTGPFLWFFITAVVAGAVVGIVACGSDDAVPDASTDGGGDGSSSSSSSSSSSGGDGASANEDDSGGKADGTVTGTIPDGGLPSDPGAVACGAASCTGSQLCCVRADGGATCVTGGGACNDLGGTRQDCNESADCPVIDGGGRQVCCYERDKDTNLLSASCHRDCNGGSTTRIQACRLSNECQSGTCAVRTCLPDAGQPAIESCAPYPNLCP